MNTAIIAEYNPFHKGHLYHINKTKEKTGDSSIIAIMSGNFTQRGEPAILDKVLRTKMALLNGVDMVLELPVEYATGSADVFAFGAIDIINKSNFIDTLSFGSESGDITAFSDLADVLNTEPEEFKTLLKMELGKGASYPVARALALSSYLNRDISFLNNPNNILALEYPRALKRTESTVWPCTIQRVVSEYNSEEMTGSISSASAIRKAFADKNIEEALSALPESCGEILIKELKSIPDIDDYSPALHYILRTKSAEEISEYADITEGLENRIINNMGRKPISEIINIIKTKRYTYTKLQRAILHIILNIKKSDQNINDGVQYIRVLGFRKEKEHLLTELSQKSSVPVITNAKTAEDYLHKEIMATDLYYMITNGEKGREYTNPIVVL